jgi:hypothetical protein
MNTNDLLLLRARTTGSPREALCFLLRHLTSTYRTKEEHKHFINLIAMKNVYVHGEMTLHTVDVDSVIRRAADAERVQWSWNS